MELEIIPKRDEIPAFDPGAIQIQLMDWGPGYSGAAITEEAVAAFLRSIPRGVEALLYLDPDGECDWLEVLSDGNWLALGFCGDLGDGEGCWYSYNPAFAGNQESTGLRSGGQSPVEKMLALQDMEAGVRAVEYFIRTGGLYPGIHWARQTD